MIGLELAQKLYPHFHLLLSGLASLFGVTLGLGLFIIWNRHQKNKNLLQANPEQRAAKAREIHKEIKYLVEIRDELDPGLISSENRKSASKKELRKINSHKKAMNALKAELTQTASNLKDLEKKNKNYESLLTKGEKKLQETKTKLENKLQEIVELNKQLKLYEQNFTSKAPLNENTGKRKEPKIKIEDYSKNEKHQTEDPLLEEFKKVLKSSNE